jgi:AGZA family xanthine/uracil permease-like MFS transporter
MAGVFMFKNVRHLEFSRMDELIPAVLTLILMPLTFNISVGIAAGFISWTALKILTGASGKSGPACGSARCWRCPPWPK